MHRLVLALVSTVALPAGALAQTATPPAPSSEPDRAAPARHQAHDGDDAIVITAPFVRELDILAGKSVLSGEDLQRESRAQIGETLLKLPGVSATGFTPGASRPVATTLVLPALKVSRMPRRSAERSVRFSRHSSDSLCEGRRVIGRRGRRVRKESFLRRE